ncbi:MAG: HEAT repeat domain-containing protein, partial [Promethearchaeota archaeon]
MSKDLKNLIDTVEKETHTEAELEKTIHSLKEEINRLEFTIKEQKILIENLKIQMEDDQIEKSELPGEIDVLKDMIISQRQELTQKDDEIDKLHEKIDELTSTYGSKEISSSGLSDNQELINAQNLIVQLTDEIDQYRNQIELLQTQIEEMELKQDKIEDLVEFAEMNEELINIKRLNFQLMEENGLLRVEIESLEAKLQKRIEEIGSEELEAANEKNTILSSELESLKSRLKEFQALNEEELKLANGKIEMLTSELEEYEAQVKFLKEQLGESSEPPVITTEDALHFTEMREELDDVKAQLIKSQNENKALNEKLNELKQELSIKKIEKIEIGENLPKRLHLSLFYRIYNFLDENKKLKIIDSLIQDLQSDNSETKRNAIKILSVVKNNKVYDAFLEMLNDKDWLVRYSIIKALSNFDKKGEELKP